MMNNKDNTPDTATVALSAFGIAVLLIIAVGLGIAVTEEIKTERAANAAAVAAGSIYKETVEVPTAWGPSIIWEIHQEHARSKRKLRILKQVPAKMPIKGVLPDSLYWEYVLFIEDYLPVDGHLVAVLGKRHFIYEYAGTYYEVFKSKQHVSGAILGLIPVESTTYSVQSRIINKPSYLD